MTKEVRQKGPLSRNQHRNSLKEDIIKYTKKIQQEDPPKRGDLHRIASILKVLPSKSFTEFLEEMLELIRILGARFQSNKHVSDEIPIMILEVLTFFKWDNDIIRKEFTRIFSPNLMVDIGSLGSDLNASRQPYLRPRKIYSLDLIQKTKPHITEKIVKDVINWQNYGLKNFFKLINFENLSKEQAESLWDYYHQDNPKWKDRPISLSLVREALDKRIGSELRMEGEKMTSEGARKKHAKIFLSYGKEDIDSARIFYERLSSKYDVWFDKESLFPGQNWKEEIPAAIRKSDFFLLLMSTQSVRKRGFYQNEIRLAIETYQEIPPDDIFLIPLRLDDCKLPSYKILEDIQYEDFFPDWEPGFERLIKAIEAQLKKKKQKKIKNHEEDKGPQSRVRFTKSIFEKRRGP